MNAAISTSTMQKRRYTRAELLELHQPTARPPQCMGCFESVGSGESLPPAAFQPKVPVEDLADDRFSFRDRQGRRGPGDARRRGGPSWMDEPVPRQAMTFDRRGVFGSQEDARDT